jgi:hypothetical protein
MTTWEGPHRVRAPWIVLALVEQLEDFQLSSGRRKNNKLRLGQNLR